MSAQVRLEALKLAVQSGAQGGNILTIAEEYTKDVEPQEAVAQHPNHQRRSRKRR